MEPLPRELRPPSEQGDPDQDGRALDPVQVAEEQSFPASDPPSWWAG
jgi:hypothetical protein